MWSDNESREDLLVSRPMQVTTVSALTVNSAGGSRSGSSEGSGCRRWHAGVCDAYAALNPGTRYSMSITCSPRGSGSYSAIDGPGSCPRQGCDIRRV